MSLNVRNLLSNVTVTVFNDIEPKILEKKKVY